MAWRCSSNTNEGMISALEKAGLIKTPLIISAMRKVDRKWFVPTNVAEFAYEDRPLPIGYGATISAPHMHAIMLEILVERASKISASEPLRMLDVGSGSGYLTAVLAAMTSHNKSKIIGIEHIKELQQNSLKAIESHLPEWIKDGTIELRVGDGRQIHTIFGTDPFFDVIHVGAAAPSVDDGWIRLLKPGGCMVVPVGMVDSPQELIVYDKDETGKVSINRAGGVQFVPLTSEQFQRQR